MRNVTLPRTKSLYIVVGFIAMATALLFSLDNDEGFSTGHIGLLLVGLVMFCSGVFVKERRLAQVSVWFIVINMVFAAASILYS